jgi:hypothetical protein
VVSGRSSSSVIRQRYTVIPLLSSVVSRPSSVVRRRWSVVGGQSSSPVIRQRSTVIPLLSSEVGRPSSVVSRQRSQVTRCCHPWCW